MKTKIFTAPTEIDASIIKGVLQNENIFAWVAPGERSLNFNTGSKGPNAPHYVWVEDKDSDKAFEIIKSL